MQHSLQAKETKVGQNSNKEGSFSQKTENYTNPTSDRTGSLPGVEGEKNDLFNIPSPSKHDKRGRHARSPRPATNTSDAVGRLQCLQFCLEK